MSPRCSPGLYLSLVLFRMMSLVCVMVTRSRASGGFGYDDLRSIYCTSGAGFPAYHSHANPTTDNVVSTWKTWWYCNRIQERIRRLLPYSTSITLSAFGADQEQPTSVHLHPTDRSPDLKMDRVHMGPTGQTHSESLTSLDSGEY